MEGEPNDNEAQPVDPTPSPPPVGEGYLAPPAAAPADAAGAWTAPPGQPPTGWGDPNLVFGAPPPTKNNKWLIIGIAAALVVAAAVVGVIAAHKSKSNEVSLTGPDRPGVTASSAAGGFSDRFPTHPRSLDVPGSLAGVSYKFHLLVSQGPPVAEVEGGTLSITLPSSDVDRTLHSTIGGIALGSGWTLSHEKTTTYRGQSARTATYTDSNGHTYTGLAFLGADRAHLYVLLADADYFPTLARHLRLTS
jgi:hypothetical protein